VAVERPDPDAGVTSDAFERDDVSGTEERGAGDGEEVRAIATRVLAASASRVIDGALRLSTNLMNRNI